MAIRPRSAGATRRLAGAATVVDVVEVARFVAERDQDATRERWLVIGQLVMLVLVLLVIGLLVAVQRG